MTAVFPPGALAHAAAAHTDEALREARMHAMLVKVQHDLAQPQLSEADVLRRAAQAAQEATGADGAMVDVLDLHGFRCAAAVGSLLGRHGHLTPLSDADHWPALSASQPLPIALPAPNAYGVAQGTLVATALRRDGVAVGVLSVHARDAKRLTHRDLEHLQILGESVAALLKLRQMATQLQASQRQYEALFQTHPQPMWVFSFDDDLRILAANEAMSRVYGYSQAELLCMGLPDLWPTGTHEVHRQALHALRHDQNVTGLALQHRRKDGALIDVEITEHGTEFNGIPARQCMAIDVTERLATERELARLARARHLLSACNEAIVRCTTEEALLDAVCQITVDVGGYRTAWVGMAQDDARKSIVCVASAGAPQDYFQNLKLSWNEADPNGRGPAGIVVRTGETVVVPNVMDSPEFAGLAKRLQAGGFHGLVCLPLWGEGRHFGLLYLYAPQVLEISTHERELLEELAKDLSFGILTLRARAQQAQMQASVLKVAASVSATTGTAFFERLVLNMVEALGGESGCLARFVTPIDPKAPHADALVLVINGAFAPNDRYTLVGTPSERLVTQTQYCVPSHLREQFPHSPVVGKTVANAYVGQQLCDEDGSPLGILFVLFRQPLRNPAFAQSSLQIFASRASAELQRQRDDAHIRRQASLLDQARDAIVVRDMAHRITYWNQGATRLYGWSAEQAIGQRFDGLLQLCADTFQRACETVQAHGEWVGELVQVHQAGHTIDTEGRWTLVSGTGGQADGILAISSDIRERKATEREIQRLAFYDALTGLPNRMLLLDRARQAIAKTDRHNVGGALLFIDLDNFKTLNDTLGHDQGDLLLQQVARRLEACVRGSDTVARLGGDEFVVMLEALNADATMLAIEARTVAEKILSSLSQPYGLVGGQYRTTPSIGIAPFARNTGTVGDLLKHADLAMYQAKTGGRNTLRFYDPNMQAVVTARAEIEADMRAALAQNEFLLHYQPQVRHDGHVVGIEALARWRHPQRGFVSPAEFIPVAEDTGLILTLGRWVLHTACTTLASWRETPELCHLTMAVNVSSKQFRSSSFVGDVARVLAITGAPADHLKLELTESVLVDDVESIIDTMQALRAMGVGFALDDFGTGYSSLSYLKRMPLSQLKIDQSFVRDLLTDPNDAAIVDTIVALSASLGLHVIAEGVETAEQRDMLLQAGCMAFQGYLYSQPLTDVSLAALLRENPALGPGLAGD